MTKTLIVIGILVGGALAFDIGAEFTSGVPSISSTVQYLGLHWNPFVIYVCGMLVGHFFLKPSYAPANYIGETGELFLVVFIGWGIFWFFYANQNLLPMTNWARFGLILFSIAVGAFIWTIESDVTWLVK